MFHLFARKSRAPKSRTSTQQLLNRALTFGAGLILLWTAFHFVPKSGSAAQPIVISDDSGTVATSSTSLPPAENVFPIGLGQLLVILLLLGLIGAAIYQQKKTKTPASAAPEFSNIGRLQLSPQQHVHLISCGEELLLVGATNTQITLLHQVAAGALQERTSICPPKAHFQAPQFSTPSTTLPGEPNFAALLHRSVRSSINDA